MRRSGVSFAALVLAGFPSGVRQGDAFTVAALVVGIVAGVVWTLVVLAGANRRLGLELASHRELFENLLKTARVASEGPGGIG